jgi:hypothetical protein
MKSWLKGERNVLGLELGYQAFVERPMEFLDLISEIFSLDGEYQLSLKLRQLHTVAGTPTRFDSDVFELKMKPMQNRVRGGLFLRVYSRLIRTIYMGTSFLWRA